jgi:hypothetical protein
MRLLFLESMTFLVTTIIRNLLDEVEPSYIFPLFTFIFDGLNDCAILDEFRSFNNNLLIALDGTQYYSSNTLTVFIAIIVVKRIIKMALSLIAIMRSWQR